MLCLLGKCCIILRKVLGSVLKFNWNRFKCYGKLPGATPLFSFASVVLVYVGFSFLNFGVLETFIQLKYLEEVQCRKCTLGTFLCSLEPCLLGPSCLSSTAPSILPSPPEDSSECNLKSTLLDHNDLRENWVEYHCQKSPCSDQGSNNKLFVHSFN